jgi:hypothetical protein
MGCISYGQETVLEIMAVIDNPAIYFSGVENVAAWEK